MSDEATQEPSAAPDDPAARTIAPWASEALLLIASKNSGYGGGATVFADCIVVRPRGFRNHIDRLLAAGFVKAQRDTVVYVLTREVAEELARRDAALAEASKPENVRAFEVAVFVHDSDVPTQRSTTKPDYASAAQWATKRLVDPEVGYSHAIITTSNGFGEILVRDELRVTITQVYKR